jgi:acyl-coenzyme A thioesterase PaaI-like protein
VGARAVGRRHAGHLNRPATKFPADRGADYGPRLMDLEERAKSHILMELGFDVEQVGEEMHGRAVVTPEMLVPGSGILRTSILAAWADTITGLRALQEIRPRVVVTQQLDVHLFASPTAGAEVHALARAVKSGRSVVVVVVDFLADGEEIGVGTAAFMPAPDPNLLMPDDMVTGRKSGGPTLSVPIAERARVQRIGPGVAVVPNGSDSRNASNTLNGGLLALVVEEAALSLTPGESLSSLAMHYLQPVRVGPAVATAEVRAGLGRVEVRDAGREDRLAVVATTRIFGA